MLDHGSWIVDNLKRLFVVGLFFIGFGLDITHAASPPVTQYPYEVQLIIPSNVQEGDKVFLNLPPEILQKVNLDFSNFNMFNHLNDPVDFSIFYEPFGKEKDFRVAGVSSQRDNPQNLVDNDLLTSFAFNERADGKNDSWVILEFDSPLSINTVKFYPKERAQIRYAEITTGLTKEDLKTTLSKQAFRRSYDLSTPLIKYMKFSFWGSSVKLDDIQVFKDEKGGVFLSPGSDDQRYRVLYGGTEKAITYKNRVSMIPSYGLEGELTKETINPLFNKDLDGDGIDIEVDNCPFVSNKNQKDLDGDGVGDVCDNAKEARNITQLDIDRDGIGDIIDNCKLDHNPDQEDLDDDDLGNVCDGAHAKEVTSEMEEEKETYQKYIPGVFLISLGIFLFFLLYKQKHN